MNRNSEATFVINYKVRDWLRLKKFSHYSVICCKDPFIHSSPGLLFPMADIFYALALGRWLLGWQTVVVVLVELLLIQEDCILPHLDWTLLDSLANGSIPEWQPPAISSLPGCSDWNAFDAVYPTWIWWQMRQFRLYTLRGHKVGIQKKSRWRRGFYWWLIYWVFLLLFCTDKGAYSALPRWWWWWWRWRWCALVVLFTEIIRRHFNCLDKHNRRSINQTMLTKRCCGRKRSSVNSAHKWMPLLLLYPAMAIFNTT